MRPISPGNRCGSGRRGFPPATRRHWAISAGDLMDVAKLDGRKSRRSVRNSIPCRSSVAIADSRPARSRTMPQCSQVRSRISRSAIAVQHGRAYRCRPRAFSPRVWTSPGPRATRRPPLPAENYWPDDLRHARRCTRLHRPHRAGNAAPAFEIGHDAAHRVVCGGMHRGGFARDIETVGETGLVNAREAMTDEVGVAADVRSSQTCGEPVRRISVTMDARNDVPRREIHAAGDSAA